MKLIFATNNAHKLEEARQILSPEIEVIGMQQAGFDADIDETGLTLEDNALLKARAVYEATGLNCFADDTGLEIEALDGRPGVFSARYAGNGHDFSANVDKVLGELKDTTNRKARFRTAVCLIIHGSEYFFEGLVNGEIMHERTGKGGFGYDPVFRPDGFVESFAELSSDEKNAISHRGRALSQLLKFIALKSF